MNEQSKEQLCASIGMKVGLLCASAGVLVAAILLFVFFTLREVQMALTSGWLAITTGLIALYASTIFLGKRAGKTICRNSSGPGGFILSGIGLALASLTAATLVGGIASGSGLDEIYFVGLGFLIVGLLPAILIGTLYGILVHRRLPKAGFLSQPKPQ